MYVNLISKDEAREAELRVSDLGWPSGPETSLRRPCQRPGSARYHTGPLSANQKPALGYLTNEKPARALPDLTARLIICVADLERETRPALGPPVLGAISDAFLPNKHSASLLVGKLWSRVGGSPPDTLPYFMIRVFEKNLVHEIKQTRLEDNGVVVLCHDVSSHPESEECGESRQSESDRKCAPCERQQPAC